MKFILQLRWRLFIFWLIQNRTSIKDEARPGCPIEVTTPEMIEKIHRIVMEDCRIKVRDIAEIRGILEDKVHNILHKEL